MKLVFPCPAYKEKATQYIREFYEHGSHINGTGGLDRYLKNATYEDWLRKIQADLDLANIPPSRVPAITYFYVREEDDAIIGMINIRLALNDALRKEAGHIGYSIRPTQRRRGYGTDMLSMALKVCDLLSIREVILTCDKSNPASAGVIVNCQGQLVEEFVSDMDQELVQRYVIRL